MSDSTTINIGLILLIALIVAMISRRMRLPYSVGLVAAGILLARVPVASGPYLSPQGIFATLLPPLIFEAALNIRWAPFRDAILAGAGMQVFCRLRAWADLLAKLRDDLNADFI